MAKKKAAKKAVKRKSAVPANAETETQERVPCMVRLAPNVHETCRRLADEAGISLNQLIHGLCNFAAQNGRVGYGRREQDGTVTCHPLTGCMWFGRPSTSEAQVMEELRRGDLTIHGDEDPNDYVDKGEFYFRLDFAERVVRRED